jgi:uncharacterized protein
MLNGGTGDLRGMHMGGNSIGSVTRLLLLVICLLGISTTAFAFSTPERNGWVTDQAGILDAETAGAIARKLTDLQRNTGDEVVVVTLSSLEGVSIETWGNALGESWRVGRSGGQDTGVLLIVAPNDRKVRIAVGYGLGNRIPDSVAATIISDHILPYFRQGNFARGVQAGVDIIALQLDRRAGTNTTDVERATPVSFKQPSLWERLKFRLRPSHSTLATAIWVAVVVLVVIWMLMNLGIVGGGGWNRYDDDNDGGWFSGGGGWSSGGGSSSGGGGSFGGGATGSW